jgi:hypothetical protein
MEVIYPIVIGTVAFFYIQLFNYNVKNRDASLFFGW